MFFSGNGIIIDVIAIAGKKDRKQVKYMGVTSLRFYIHILLYFDQPQSSVHKKG